MRRFTRITAGLGIAAVAVAGIGFAVQGSTGAASAAPQVLLAEGDDRLPSGTAADWVTYADHVVVVKVGAEKSMQPTRTELDRGEGLIGRKVDLEFTKVLWSRKNAAKPAPRGWEYNATGWVFSDGKPESRMAMALHGRPRIETGHEYVLAITWEGPQCSTGDAAEAGRWMGLGEGSELPFDGGVIGQGENEGRVQDVAAARSAAAKVGTTGDLEDQLAGQSASDLVAKLTTATPQAKQVPLRAQASC